MNMLVMENFRNDEVPEIDVNIYNSKSNKNKTVYNCTMQFTGEQFICHRVYNGVVINSTLGHSYSINYSMLLKKGVDKQTIINIMKDAIICCILNTSTVIRDLEMVFTDFIYIAPNPFAMKKKDIDKFIEDCYFMIS